ncbi:hypothetical protein [Halomonas urumqiensis]|uniref:Lipoprotein n=1 Tax=Halomonas urumqiensis TaxID=1684789 RepID=A0A2N7ULE7_9GAMM|nr:hypothetical protein [Halomonas urumqiensis]PMR81270.1 hypothetical protein C1H70_05880 [Halomonas urumqiensis]PTB01798.1 hypothetical protein C6V82_13830 [Halomonas urumqiensis]
MRFVLNRGWIAALLVMLLGGCASSPQVIDPRELSLTASPEQTLRASAETLITRGYVIRHADSDLGRLEALLSRWPGYRLQVQVRAEGQGSRVSMVATRGGRAMPPWTLDPLLMDIQNRLDLLP